MLELLDIAQHGRDGGGIATTASTIPAAFLSRSSRFSRQSKILNALFIAMISKKQTKINHVHSSTYTYQVLYAAVVAHDIMRT